MPRQPRGRLAWALCALAAAFGVGTVVLAVLNRTPLRDFVVDYAAVGPTVGLSSTLLGALILSRRPDNRIGWVLCALGLGLAASMASYEYGKFALLTRPGSLPGGAVAAWWSSWTWMPSLGLVPLLFLLFPDGRLRTRRWRPVAWAAAVSLVVPPLVVAVSNWPHRGPVLLSTQEFLPTTTAVRTGFFIAVMLLLAAGMAAVLARLRGARGVERQQVKWLLYGGTVAVATTVVPVAVPALDSGVTGLLAYAWLLSAFAVAIFHYRLYDIDNIIRRTLVYGLVTGVLGTGYALAVLILVHVLGQDRSSFAVAAATLAVAAALQPARRAIQGVVDRRFNRRNYDAAKTIESFSRHMRAQIDLDGLTAELLEVVNQTLGPKRVSLWLQPPSQREAPGPDAPR